MLNVRALVAELIGTFFLVFTIGMTVINPSEYMQDMVADAGVGGGAPGGYKKKTAPPTPCIIWVCGVGGGMGGFVGGSSSEVWSRPKSDLSTRCA